ncbi:MAG: mercury transporter MerT [Burkholderiales bacterium]|nr:mercury transporter MerT [Burkholderiales bacterium]
MNAKQSLLASALGAIGASACCVLPLVLLTLGIGGAWVAQLTKLEPYRPIFVLITLIFLVLAWRKLYRAPQACDASKPCANDKIIARQRALFWISVLPLVALLVFPWFAPYFY